MFKGDIIPALTCVCVHTRSRILPERQMFRRDQKRRPLVVPSSHPCRGGSGFVPQTKSLRCVAIVAYCPKPAAGTSPSGVLLMAWEGRPAVNLCPSAHTSRLSEMIGALTTNPPPPPRFPLPLPIHPVNPPAGGLQVWK